jgi:hypothetical protein
MLNKKALPLSLGLLAIPFASSILSLTSCNKSEFNETTISFSDQKFQNYLETHHTVFNEPLDITTATSEQIKDYFFTNNRITGKNLAILAVSALQKQVLVSMPSNYIDGVKIKIGYNDKSCFARLESDFSLSETQTTYVYKSGSYVGFSILNDRITSKGEVIFSINDNDDSVERITRYDSKVLLSEISNFIISKEEEYLVLECWAHYKVDAGGNASYTPIDINFDPS